jgi:hypothetical protein
VAQINREFTALPWPRHQPFIEGAARRPGALRRPPTPPAVAPPDPIKSPLRRQTGPRRQVGKRDTVERSRHTLGSAVAAASKCRLREADPPDEHVATPRICPHSVAGGLPAVASAPAVTMAFALDQIVLVYYYSHTVGRILMRLPVGAHGPIPVRSLLADQLRQVIEGGGVPGALRLASGRWSVASAAIRIRRRASSRISSGADTGRSAPAQRRREPSSIAGAATVKGRHALRRGRGRDVGEP